MDFSARSIGKCESLKGLSLIDALLVESFSHIGSSEGGDGGGIGERLDQTRRGFIRLVIERSV